MNYDIKKGRNFHEWNGIKYDVDTFYPELAWETVAFNNRTKQVMHKVWGYAKGSFPCPMCKRVDDVVFIIEATGVVAKCTLCKVGILVPPMDPEHPQDADKNYGELLVSEPVSLEEGYKIAKRIGAESELPPDVTQSKSRKRFGQAKAETTS